MSVFDFFQAHSCVEKAGLIAMVRVHELPVDENFSLRGKTLEEFIRIDKEKGLIPFLVCRTKNSIELFKLKNSFF